MPEKDYNAIAKRKIRRPSEIETLPKILVYGRNKKGKTRFCVSGGVDDILIIDPESGTDRMKKIDPNVWPIDRWEDRAEVYGYLRGGKHPYRWVAVDGLSRMNDMALDFVMRTREARQMDSQPGMVAQKDWGQAGKVMKTMLVQFHGLPMGVIYTAQERQMETVDSEADTDVEGSSLAFVADLPKSVRGMVNSLVDIIGRIYVANVDKADGTTIKQRRLWLGDHPLYDTGFRSDYKLPDFIRNPTVPKLIELIDTGAVLRR